MAKGGPTLYEARRAKDGVTALPHAMGSRAMRVPLGFVLIAAAIVLAFATGTYFLGYRAGVAAADQADAQARQGATRTIDPLLSQPTAPAQLGSTNPRIDSPEIAPQPRRTAPASLDSPLDSPLGPPPVGDPRQVGLNYFILADGLRPEGAAEVVAFCRSQGLDAITVPSHNARSQVIVLPGYGREGREVAPVKALEAKIRAVGAKWKALGRGNGDFRDSYPKIFKG